VCPRAPHAKACTKKKTPDTVNLKRNKIKCAEPPGSQKLISVVADVMWRVSPMPIFHVGIHCLIGFHCLLESLLEPFDSEEYITNNPREAQQVYLTFTSCKVFTIGNIVGMISYIIPR
jgi:hypothetical protein